MRSELLSHYSFNRVAPWLCVLEKSHGVAIYATRLGANILTTQPPPPPPGKAGTTLACYWVGSLDFNFLVEIRWGFPLNPQKVIHFLQRGHYSNQGQKSIPPWCPVVGAPFAEKPKGVGADQLRPLAERGDPGAISALRRSASSRVSYIATNEHMEPDVHTPVPSGKGSKPGPSIRQVTREKGGGWGLCMRIFAAFSSTFRKTEPLEG